MSSVLSSCCIFLDHSNICASARTMAAAPNGDPRRGAVRLHFDSLIKLAVAGRTITMAARKSPRCAATHGPGLRRRSPALPWVPVIAVLAAKHDSQELRPCKPSAIAEIWTGQHAED